MANKGIWAPIWITQDMCIWEGKVEVSMIIVSAKTLACAVTCYAGRDSGASILGIFEAEANHSESFSFPEEFTLENGLYIDIDTNTRGVLVIFRPISEITE